MNTQHRKAFSILNQIKYKPNKKLKPLDEYAQRMHSKEKGGCGKPLRFCDCLQEKVK